ncbi:MAG: ADP-ribosylation factor-like protein, partial [Acidobacteriota bacterium]|nr:ADP-ribosylation factor-like protein [Acidobacteriota bacterium]
MFKKLFTKQDSDDKKQTTEEIVEERIAKWQKKGDITDPLDLKGIGLTAFPEALRYLRIRLLSLDLSNNAITTIPDWIDELSSLVAVILNHNEIKKLPEKIGSLPLLSLYLAHNSLEELPRSLQELHLLALWLNGNPKLNIPDSILKSSPKEILRYYFESRDEKGAPLLELKMLLVGRGGAGKTTLVKRIAGEKPKLKESETHSISIRELTLNCERGKVKARAWDFGGQEILHATHQFFLSERSLYLLVLEPRTGLAQRDAEYWLKLVETQGGGSPVIVVLNWSHGRRWQVDEVKLRRKFPFVVDFISTDAWHGDGLD